MLYNRVSNVVSELVVSGYCYLLLVLNYIGIVVLNMHMHGVYTIQPCFPSMLTSSFSSTLDPALRRALTISAFPLLTAR